MDDNLQKLTIATTTGVVGALSIIIAGFIILGMLTFTGVHWGDWWYFPPTFALMWSIICMAWADEYIEKPDK